MNDNTSSEHKATRQTAPTTTNSPQTDDPENSPPSSDGPRRAKMNRRPDGSALGAAVFLTGDDLEALGIDPDATDAVEVRVTDGDLELTPAHAEGSDQ